MSDWKWDYKTGNMSGHKPVETADIEAAMYKTYCEQWDHLLANTPEKEHWAIQRAKSHGSSYFSYTLACHRDKLKAPEKDDSGETQ